MTPLASTSTNNVGNANGQQQHVAHQTMSQQQQQQSLQPGVGGVGTGVNNGQQGLINGGDGGWRVAGPGGGHTAGAAPGNGVIQTGGGGSGIRAGGGGSGMRSSTSSEAISSMGMQQPNLQVNHPHNNGSSNFESGMTGPVVGTKANASAHARMVNDAGQLAAHTEGMIRNMRTNST